MDRLEVHKNIHYYLVMLIAFSLPIARFTPIVIVLLALNWLIEANFKAKFSAFIKNKFALLFASLYILHLLGMLYTLNTDFGLKDMEVKMSLLLFPLLLSYHKFSKGNLDKIFYSFFIGCWFACVAMLSRATYTYFVYDENNFFYQNFAFLLHPSYMSMYLNLIIVWLLFKMKEIEKKYLKIFFAFSVLIFIGVNVLLSSKLGIASSFLMLFIFIIIYIVKYKKYVSGIVGLTIMATSVFVIVKFVPAVKERVKNALLVFSSDTVDKSNAESTAIRTLIWGAAKNVITENVWMGVGTGDSKDALMEEYKKKNITAAYEHKLNAHNEYLQVFVALGIVGVIVLLMGLLLPLYYSIVNKNYIYIVFLIIIMLNFSTESMFETQAGIMFYAFFNSLLCFKFVKKDKAHT